MLEPIGESGPSSQAPVEADRVEGPSSRVAELLARERQSREATREPRLLQDQLTLTLESLSRLEEERAQSAHATDPAAEPERDGARSFENEEDRRVLPLEDGRAEEAERPTLGSARPTPYVGDAADAEPPRLTLDLLG